MGKLLFATASLAAMVVAGHASAQTAGSNAIVEEVVVTAEKREQNLQDVPTTVTAVSGSALQRQGVTDIGQIQKVAPEVTVQPGTFANVAIRGIRTGAFAPTTEGTNAIHVDGVYLSRFTALNGLFFDVQRVEVLAGPQGTLYGRNSAGGTVNVITNKPTKDFGGRASVEFGNYNALIANAAINVPLSDTLAMRLAFYRAQHKGYNDNGTDDLDLTSARFSALWMPNDGDRLLLTADIQRQGGKGGGPNQITEVLKNPTVLTAANGSVSLVPAGTPGGVVVPINMTGDIRDVTALYGEQDRARVDNQTSGAMVQWDHSMSFATLTAQASFRDNTLDNRSGSTLGFQVDPRLITLGVGLRPNAGALNGYFKWFSEEVRLTSAETQPLQWLIGLYGFQERAVHSNNIGYRVIFPNAAGQIGQASFPSPDVINSNIANPSNNVDAYAVFGQITYSPVALENLHITLGGRYNTEKKATRGFEILNGGLVNNTVFNLSKTFRKFTYKVNVAYDLTPDNMIYVDNSTGFKSGGFAYGPTPGYEPETIKSWEIGSKNRFLNGALQVNASAWHYDYSNYVTTVQEFFLDTSFSPPRPNGYLDVTNAASAKVDGQSVQVSWAASDDDLFGFNMTHLNAKWDKFDVSAGQAFAFAAGLLPGATPSYFDYSGGPIGGAVDLAGSGTYDHTFHLAGGALDAQVFVNYQGKFLPGNQVAKANVNAFLEVSPVTTGDISLRYKPDGKTWTLTGYVRNITDETVVTARGYASNAAFRAVSDPLTFYAYRTAIFGAPRTFGVIFDAQF